VATVKAQAFPAFTISGIIFSEIKSLETACIIPYLAPEVQRGNDLLANLLWFLMSIVVADFCFDACHWLLHRKPRLKYHLKHHNYQDTSSFVAVRKGLPESAVTTITDLLPIFILAMTSTNCSPGLSLARHAISKAIARVRYSSSHQTFTVCTTQASRQPWHSRIAGQSVQDLEHTHLSTPACLSGEFSPSQLITARLATCCRWWALAPVRSWF
jgi:hypothetical protein